MAFAWVLVVLAIIIIWWRQENHRLARPATDAAKESVRTNATTNKVPGEAGP